MGCFAINRCLNTTGVPLGPGAAHSRGWGGLVFILGWDAVSWPINRHRLINPTLQLRTRLDSSVKDIHIQIIQEDVCNN